MVTAELPTLVHEYLGQQVAVLVEGVDDIRRGDFRVVHRTRVAVRRLRSTLRTFGALYPASARDGLDDELRWLAVTLGEVRDREVLRLVVDEFVSRHQVAGGAHVRETLRQALHRRLDAETAAHLGEVRHALASPRCLALLGRVARLPALRPGADADRREVPADPVARRRQVVSRRFARALADPAPERLHDTRKAVKRARYAAEVLAGPALAGPAPAGAPDPPEEPPAAVLAARAFEELQECLGRYQDLTVAREFVADAAVEERLLAEELEGLGAGLAAEAEQVRSEALALAQTHGLLLDDDARAR